MTSLEPTLFFRRIVAAIVICFLSVDAFGAAVAEKEEKPVAKVETKDAEAAAAEAPKTEKKPAANGVKEEKPAPKDEAAVVKEEKAQPAEDMKKAAVTPEPTVDPDDEVAAEKQDAQVAAVAKPVSADPVQIYGWREHIFIKDVEEKLQAKLDTGALTSSIHAEEKELFERDGKKWVRFIVTDPSVEKPARTRIEAPLVRIARVKEPGGESVAREVVKLSFTIGDRKMRGEFTLNNRSNMLAPVLIGRSMIKDLGWIDPSRTYLADQKIFR